MKRWRNIFLLFLAALLLWLLFGEDRAMLREARNARNSAEVKRLVQKYRLMESPLNPHSGEGIWGAEYRLYWGDFYRKFHAFAWKFDQQGNVKDYLRGSQTKVFGIEFNGGENFE